ERSAIHPSLEDEKWMPANLRPIYLQKVCTPHGKLYQMSREYSDALVSLLADPTLNWMIRGAAGEALQASLVVDEKHIPMLITMLRSEEQDVLETAIMTLYQMGPAAKSSIPALTEIWKDESETEQTRNAAGEVLLGLSPEFAKELGIAGEPAKKD